MSDLAATNCGGSCGCNDNNGSWIWIILLLCCCGNGGGIGGGIGGGSGGCRFFLFSFKAINKSSYIILK